jgi:hypothetical protein
MFTYGRGFDGVRLNRLYSDIYGYRREAEVWIKQNPAWTAEPNNLNHM